MTPKLAAEAEKNLGAKPNIFVILDKDIYTCIQSEYLILPLNKAALYIIKRSLIVPKSLTIITQLSFSEFPALWLYMVKSEQLWNSVKWCILFKPFEIHSIN